MQTHFDNNLKERSPLMSRSDSSMLTPLATLDIVYNYHANAQITVLTNNKLLLNDTNNISALTEFCSMKQPIY